MLSLHTNFRERDLKGKELNLFAGEIGPPGPPVRLHVLFVFTLCLLLIVLRSLERSLQILGLAWHTRHDRIAGLSRKVFFECEI